MSIGWLARNWGRDLLSRAPVDYLPMLATACPDAFDDPHWWFEVKWDGYRCIAVGREQGGNRLRSRRGLDLADRFPEIAALELPPGWVLDGEIVVFDDEGRSSFSLLQEGKPANYVVFDVLASPDDDLIGLALEERRRLLSSLDFPAAVVTSDPIQGSGRALYDAAKQRGLEGVVAKRGGSPYQPGRRSSDWRKIAARHRLRAVVGGWTPGDGGRRSTFGSLLVGLWEDDRLRWIGAVGSGFADRDLARLMPYLEEREQPSSPFAATTGMPRGARWVRPELVAEVEYKEWTREKRLRAPVFKGLETAGQAPTWEEEGPGGS